ncbi:Crp/Fnr family transcriptional regulator [uncultured Pseudomonas sp.]|uniref:Crp/Fnr family transcriptional regulator n=1 Tax=uncultured Pseudomonas sp. TaxID=114707 RepID=UPI00259011B3|nr:Crp/Fnr family transcriptional regulator [uncultured Pseudomonas sp.]
MDNPLAWRAQLSHGQWFRQLPAQVQDSLLALARSRELAAGQCLFQRGDPPCGLYAVLEGAMRVGAVSRDGKEALLTLVEPPYWFGEISLFDGQPRTHDAFAEGVTQLLWIPQAALLDWLAQHPQHWRDLALLMSHKLRWVFVALEQQHLLAAGPRVAHRLLQIAEGYGERDVAQWRLQLSQEQLALMLSLSRQTINQILKALEQAGVVQLGYGEVLILDAPRLREMAAHPG